MLHLCREPRTRCLKIHARSRYSPNGIGRRLCPLTDATLAFVCRQSDARQPYLAQLPRTRSWEFGDFKFPVTDAQEFHRPNSGWIIFTTGSGSVTVRQGPYRLTQKYEPETMEGQIYIEREKDAEPRLIFTNRRAVEFLTGQVLHEYRTASPIFPW